jgi:hypothetical protein
MEGVLPTTIRYYPHRGDIEYNSGETKTNLPVNILGVFEALKRLSIKERSDDIECSKVVPRTDIYRPVH